VLKHGKRMTWPRHGVVLDCAQGMKQWSLQNKHIEINLNNYIPIQYQHISTSENQIICITIDQWVTVHFSTSKTKDRETLKKNDMIKAQSYLRLHKACSNGAYKISTLRLTSIIILPFNLNTSTSENQIICITIDEMGDWICWDWWMRFNAWNFPGWYVIWIPELL